MPNRPLLRLTRRAALQTTALTLAAATTPVVATRVWAQATPLPSQGDALAPDLQLATLNLITNALAAHQTPGALVGVWAPGQGVAMIAAGLGELATAAPISTDDHVRIASITKTFTATVVLQLAAEGQLGLDDPLADYVADIPNGEEITLRQLLAMRSGIYDFAGLPVLVQAYAADPRLAFDPERAVQIIRDRDQPAFAPGTQYGYSNSNYVLLGLIIEQVTGQRVGAAITERIIDPLGLTGTSYPETPELPDPFAHGYDGVTSTTPLRDVSEQNPAFFAAAGAMVSTLLDLKVWAAALATGALLTPELHAAQTEFTPVEGAGDFGYGLGVLSLYGMIGHNGGVPGYMSWMLYEPESATTFVVVTTRSPPLSGAADEIMLGLGALFLPDRFTTPPSATPTG